jgi:ankyrin repeat protein
MTALMWAAHHGQAPKGGHQVEMAKMLLGSDPRAVLARDKRGSAALHLTLMSDLQVCFLLSAVCCLLLRFAFRLLFVACYICCILSAI